MKISPSAFVGICSVPFDCWGNRLGIGILSPGETQRQVTKHTRAARWDIVFRSRSDGSTSILFFDLQVSKEAGADVLSFPQPGRDERRGRSAVQLPAHAEEAHSER